MPGISPLLSGRLAWRYQAGLFLSPQGSPPPLAPLPGPTLL